MSSRDAIFKSLPCYSAEGTYRVDIIIIFLIIMVYIALVMAESQSAPSQPSQSGGSSSGADAQNAPEDTGEQMGLLFTGALGSHITTNAGTLLSFSGLDT